MKRFLTLVLLFCLVANGLLAQKKADKGIQTYFALKLGYTVASAGKALSFNMEYQFRNEKIGIGVGFGVEYATYNGEGLHLRYPVGHYVYGWKPFVPTIYQSNEQQINMAPSLLGYYYLRPKKRWEGFFKTGIVANYNAWYDYKGLAYKTDNEGKVTDLDFTPVNQTTQSIDLRSINWLIGGGVQYTLNRKTALHMTSEIQWGRGVSILGGVVFKI